MFHSRKRGFTLMELMIVMLVIGLLVAMLFPVLNSAMEATRATGCKFNLSQLGLALIAGDGQMSASMYFLQEDDSTDPGGGDPTGQIRKVLSASKMGTDFQLSSLQSGQPGIGETGTPFSFFVRLLPHLGQPAIQDDMNDTLGPFDPPGSGTDEELWDGNRGLAARVIPLLLCPSMGESVAIGETWNNLEGESGPPALTQYKAVGGATLDVMLSRNECVRDQGAGGVIHPWRRAAVTRLSDEANTAILFETREVEFSAWIDGVYASIPGLTSSDDSGGSGSGSQGRVGLNVGPTGDPEETVENYLQMINDNSGGTEGSSGGSTLGTGTMEWGPSSNHGNSVNHLMGGRSVRVIADDVDLRAYRAILTRNGRDNRYIRDLFNKN